jgi:general secretion pathway protein J
MSLMDRKDSKPSQKGFTLLEVLIAMFIFAVVLSTLYVAYTGTFRNIEETESQADLYQMARIVLERMTEDLESVYMAAQTKEATGEETVEEDQSTRFVGTMAETEGKRLDTLRFASKAHIVFNGGEPYPGTAEIVYYVRENSGEEGGFTLYRTDRANFLHREEEATGGWILCDHLYAIQFTYYDEQGGAYDNWDSTDEAFKDKLPSGVSILLELVNKDNPESPLKFMTGVALPMSKGDYEQTS